MFPNVIVGEYINLWRFEYWKWWLPHETYDPVNNGRLHLFGKLYFGIIPFSLVTMYKVKSSVIQAVINYLEYSTWFVHNSTTVLDIPCRGFKVFY